MKGGKRWESMVRQVVDSLAVSFTPHLLPKPTARGDKSRYLRDRTLGREAGDGNFDGELCAFAFLAPNLDRSAMGGADGFHDRQAEPGAAELPRTGFDDA